MIEERERTRRLLTLIAGGDVSAGSELLAKLYAELRGIAERCMAGERADHTLQPTALVHEAYVRLFESGSPHLEGRAHFVRLAARAMRNVLIDHARARGARKRVSGERLDALDLTLSYIEESTYEVLDLEHALVRLEAMDEELARLVELRFFAGLSLPEIADLDGVSVPTLERRWRVARSWLKSELGGKGLLE